MTLSFGLYTWLYEPEAGPDIPFAALPLEIQQEVNNAISEARQARSFGDVNGALFYLEQAYQLHPRNANVMGELDQLLQPFISEVKQVNTSEQAGIFISQLDELLKYEALSQNPELRRLRDKLVAIRGQ